MLYVTGGKFKFFSLSANAFDQNHENEDVEYEKGANDCMNVKDVGTSQSNSNLPFTQVNSSLNPLKLLDESDASRRMDESDTSRRLDMSVVLEWMKLILSTISKHWIKICISSCSGCGDPGYTFQETQGNVSQVNRYEQMLSLFN